MVHEPSFSDGWPRSISGDPCSISQWAFFLASWGFTRAVVVQQRCLHNRQDSLIHLADTTNGPPVTPQPYPSTCTVYCEQRGRATSAWGVQEPRSPPVHPLLFPQDKAPRVDDNFNFIDEADEVNYDEPAPLAMHLYSQQEPQPPPNVTPPKGAPLVVQARPASADLRGSVESIPLTEQVR